MIDSPRTLLAPEALGARRHAAREELAPLAASLAHDLEPLLDREPFIPADRYDPRNRRMSITLAWSDSMPGGEEHPLDVAEQPKFANKAMVAPPPAG